MKIVPRIEKRNEFSRPCNCGRDHKITIIRGMFYYAEDHHVAFCAGLLEHSGDKHVWLSFITGEWPETYHPDCYVTSDIWATDGGRIMRIEDSTSSPFESSEVFDCYPVTREQVLEVEGAKEWFINTYLKLFDTDDAIGVFLENTSTGAALD
jgi:hypothetical protein